uniref:rRNA-processing protein FYV7 n=1 Tax=Oryza rufipogon TaxID=4529 RepID=A0A0E0RIA0_ORYRU
MSRTPDPLEATHPTTGSKPNQTGKTGEETISLGAEEGVEDARHGLAGGDIGQPSARRVLESSLHSAGSSCYVRTGDCAVVVRGVEQYLYIVVAAASHGSAVFRGAPPPPRRRPSPQEPAMKRPPPREDGAGSGGGDGAKKGKGRWGGGGRRRNEQRRGSGGGGALSLAAFAYAKSRNTGYNPALIKKQKEFYKNAKLISKYKRSKKQQNQSSNPPPFPIPKEGGDDANNASKLHSKKKKRVAPSLNEEYEKKRAEDEKAKKEREAIIQAKREERERSEARRRDLREKMFKKTRSGQPVMKYRIQHLLETALESSNKRCNLPNQLVLSVNSSSSSYLAF